MTTTLTQRLGYPNASIRMFENYDNYLNSKFIDMSGTFISMTMRDGLYGTNEGLLQVYDINNLHTHMTGDELITVKVSNSNSQTSRIRIYAIKHFSVSVDNKGDNVLTIQLATYHKVKNSKFGRTFFSNATQTIESMISAIYSDAPLIAPVIDGINVFVPQFPWCSTINEYMQFTRDIGLVVSSDYFPFVWEDFSGLHLRDYKTMIAQDPINFIVGAPEMLGSYGDRLKYPLAFNFEYQTKSNSYTRNPVTDATFFAHSFLDQNVTRIANGTGINSILVSRSGAYSDMIYRNGYEEALRLGIMSQYDSYAKVTIYGNFDIMPCQRVQFYDSKNQFLSNFYIDEVIHEVSMETSLTHMYLFANSKTLTDVSPIKVKNELKTTDGD